jgi:serine/threonine protein kinase
MLQDTARRPAGRDGTQGAVGRTVCGWTIERLLGVGPVSESWLASRATARAVVRLLGPRLVADEAARADWLRASWSANRFYHPGVVKVLDQGADDAGVPAVVRAWARGESLQRTVERRAIDEPLALRIAEQILDALEMAHAHGIVHACLSPTNVIVTQHGSVLVTDLGLHGRALLAAARVGPFVAPECRAVLDVPPSEQADIWSVGTCLRFALGAATVSPEAAAVLALATAPQPRDRYGSAYAMLGDVRRVLAGRPPKLRGALAPVPSQSLRVPPDLLQRAGAPSTPPSRAPAGAAAEPESPAAGEWRGNAVLVAAIALLVAVATFVVARERIADTSRGPAPSHER